MFVLAIKVLATIEYEQQNNRICLTAHRICCNLMPVGFGKKHLISFILAYEPDVEFFAFAYHTSKKFSLQSFVRLGHDHW